MPPRSQCDWTNVKIAKTQSRVGTDGRRTTPAPRDIGSHTCLQIPDAIRRLLFGVSGEDHF